MKPHNKFRYQITNRLGVLQAEPLGESDFVIEWTRIDTGNLDYKNELPSKVVFTGPVYSNLLKLEKSIYRCDYVKLTVERLCTTSGADIWVPWFSGRMSLNEGTWDLDRCQVEIKLDDIKEEQCFEDNKSEEVDVLLNAFGRRAVYLNPTNLIIETVDYSITGGAGTPACSGSPIVWGGAGTPEDGGWSYYAYNRTQDLVGGPGTEICTTVTSWAREVLYITCGLPSPGPEWVLITDTCPGGDRKFARPARTYACEYTYDLGSDQPASGYNCLILGNASTNVSIDNGIPIEAVIYMYMQRFCPDLTFVSDFLQINPVTVSDDNYVTGQRSKTRYLTMYQKSDVKRFNAINNATMGKYSWEKLMEALVNMFNLRWRIVGNIFRLEHVSFFGRIPGFDLTLPQYARNIKGKRRYTYDNGQIPAKEEFKFMEAGAGDFTGVPIIYSGGCVSRSSRGNTKTYTVDRITTDVELCMSNPDSDNNVVDDDGFVLVAADFDGTDYFMISESSILGGANINNSLAWAQLHRDYHKWDRPLATGIMNNVQTSFFSVKPTKKGEKISISLCCGDSFDPDNTIKTPLGIGIVDKATFSFKDETLEVELLYPADLGLTQNAAPVANNDVIDTYKNVPVVINVLANDTDADPGATVTKIRIIALPIHGTAVVNPDMTITYTPAFDYTGDDLFTYSLYDDWSEESAPALIAVTVRVPNVGPNAVNDNYIGEKDVPLSISAGAGILINDTDDVSFTLNSADTASANGGTVAVNPDGSFTYTPAAGFVGFDTFNYQIIDGAGLTDNAVVTIDVRDPAVPVAVNDGLYTTRKNTPFTLVAPGILANDSTVTGTLVAVAGTFATVNGGSIAIASDGSFVYTPLTGYTGPDSYVYTVSNGINTDTATISFDVFPDVYVKLQKIFISESTGDQLCVSGSELAYTARLYYFRLFFYSNSGGTTPMDVTGLGLSVNTRRFYITNTDTTEAVSGTQWDLFGGPYESYREEYSCEGATTSFRDEVVTVQPGLYTVI